MIFFAILQISFYELENILSRNSQVSLNCGRTMSDSGNSITSPSLFLIDLGHARYWFHICYGEQLRACVLVFRGEVKDFLRRLRSSGWLGLVGVGLKNPKEEHL